MPEEATVPVRQNKPLESDRRSSSQPRDLEREAPKLAAFETNVAKEAPIYKERVGDSISSFRKGNFIHEPTNGLLIEKQLPIFLRKNKFSTIF